MKESGNKDAPRKTRSQTFIILSEPRSGNIWKQSRIQILQKHRAEHSAEVRTQQRRESKNELRERENRQKQSEMEESCSSPAIVPDFAREEQRDHQNWAAVARRQHEAARRQHALNIHLRGDEEGAHEQRNGMSYPALPNSNKQ